MVLKLGDFAPDFTCESTHGKLRWREFLRGGPPGSWTVLFSHPNDFTPVCTTELGTVARLQDQFAKRNVKLAALSCNSTDSHLKWISDIEASSWSGGSKVQFPIIADPDRTIADLYGMIDPDEFDDQRQRMTARAVYVFGPDMRLKASLLYPATTGRSFEEILRLIDSLQLTLKHPVATPVEWKRGSSCMVIPTLSDSEATAKLGEFQKVAVPSGRNYIRITADPAHKAPLISLATAKTVAAAAASLALGVLVGRCTASKGDGLGKSKSATTKKQSRDSSSTAADSRAQFAALV